jgi:hypothetical protein
MGDAQLRRRMGEAGRERARQMFDWAVIYAQYQTLWDELDARRRSAAQQNKLRHPKLRPDRPDPFAIFAGYPTSCLTGESQVAATPNLHPGLNIRRQLAMNTFATAIQLENAECELILDLLSHTETLTVNAIASKFPPDRRQSIIRGIVWLAKMEAVRITPA